MYGFRYTRQSFCFTATNCGALSGRLRGDAAPNYSCFRWTHTCGSQTLSGRFYHSLRRGRKALQSSGCFRGAQITADAFSPNVSCQFKATRNCSSSTTASQNLLNRLGAPSKSLAEFEDDLAPGLKLVDEKVEQAIRELEELRKDVPKWRQAFGAVRDISSSEKKHLFRPQLVFLGYAGGKNVEDLSSIFTTTDNLDCLVEFAAGVELQHVFMFVHDDMMDHAITRRGQDTIQVAISRSERGESELDRVSISPETVQHLTTLVGDVLQAKSLALLVQGERRCTSAGSSKNAIDVVLEGAFRAGAAQFDDILGWTGIERALRKTNSEEDADNLLIRLLGDKASFHSFAAPLIAGLRLGSEQVDPSLEAACTRWAMCVGAAFQGLDDVIDLVLEVKESGKDRLQDIQEGRLCIPLFILRQESTNEEWARVYDILGSKSVMPPSERHFLLKLAQTYKLTARTLEFVDGEIEKARMVLDAEPLASNKTLNRGMLVFVNGLVKLSTSLKEHNYL